MKKIIVASLVGTFLFCSSVFAAETETVGTIDGFRGFSWGTSLEDVMAGENTEEMEKYTDYRIIEDLSEASTLEVEGVSELILKNAEVAGYEAETTFVFHDNKLIAGRYWLEVDQEEEEDAIQDLLKKYTSVYGEPLLSRTDSGWGPFNLWVDTDKNFIYLDGFPSIEYSYIDAPYVRELCHLDEEEKYFHVDIEEEINKIGNVGGI